MSRSNIPWEEGERRKNTTNTQKYKETMLLSQQLRQASHRSGSHVTVSLTSFSGVLVTRFLIFSNGCIEIVTCFHMSTKVVRFRKNTNILSTVDAAPSTTITCALLRYALVALLLLFRARYCWRCKIMSAEKHWRLFEVEVENTSVGVWFGKRW